MNSYFCDTTLAVTSSIMFRSAIDRSGPPAHPGEPRGGRYLLEMWLTDSEGRW